MSCNKPQGKLTGYRFYINLDEQRKLTGAPEQRYWQNRETANVGLDSSVGRAPARQSGGRRFKSRSSQFSLFIQIYITLHNKVILWSLWVICWPLLDVVLLIDLSSLNPASFHVQTYTVYVECASKPSMVNPVVVWLTPSERCGVVIGSHWSLLISAYSKM